MKKYSFEKPFMAPAMLVLALAFGFVVSTSFVSCDNGTTSSNKFNGTWTRSTYKVICSGSNYTFQQNNTNIQRGTFAYTDSAVTFSRSHNWVNNTWVSTTAGPVTFSYSFSGNTLTLRGGTGADAVLNGTWTR